MKAYALDILNGLNEVHRNDIIHADIKPHNFLLFKHDDNEQDELDENDDDNLSTDSFDPSLLLKLTDFGLSHVLASGNTKAHMKLKCGTFAYTAPEIANVYNIYINM